MAWGIGTACPKPEPRKRTKARKDRMDAKRLEAFRDAVWLREEKKFFGGGVVPAYLALCQYCFRLVCRDEDFETSGEVHHRIPRSRCTREQRYDPTNGVLLCNHFVNDCHRKAQEHLIDV